MGNSSQEVLMKRSFALCLVMGAIVGVTACGGSPETQGRPDRSPRQTPQPLPTRSTSSVQDLDVVALFPEYQVYFSGPYWVQLDHRETENLSVVVGVEPSNKGADLRTLVEEHKEEMDHPPGARHHESGDRQSEILGSFMWSWGTIGEGEEALEQLVIFAAHPVDSSLLIARSEFPVEDGDIKPQLDELIRIAEIIGPTL